MGEWPQHRPVLADVYLSTERLCPIMRLQRTVQREQVRQELWTAISVTVRLAFPHLKAEPPSSSYHLNSFWCLFDRYHVPRSLIQQGKTNRLVLFEEVGGDPTLVSFALRETGSLCAHVSQSHPPPVDAVNTAQKKGAVLHLECPHSDRVISSVKFASFGTPHGTCGSYSHGNCSSTTALAILQQVRTSYSSTSLSLSLKLNWFVYTPAGMHWRQELRREGLDRGVWRSVQGRRQEPCGGSIVLVIECCIRSWEE